MRCDMNQFFEFLAFPQPFLKKNHIDHSKYIDKRRDIQGYTEYYWNLRQQVIINIDQIVAVYWGEDLHETYEGYQTIIYLNAGPKLALPGISPQSFLFDVKQALQNEIDLIAGARELYFDKKLEEYVWNHGHKSDS